jgi:hypothetical protein
LSFLSGSSSRPRFHIWHYQKPLLCATDLVQSHFGPDAIATFPPSRYFKSGSILLPCHVNDRSEVAVSEMAVPDFNVGGRRRT